MKYMNKIVCLAIAISMLAACESANKEFEQDIATGDLLHDAMKAYSDVIVYDIFSPPQAARNYAYASIAAYEVIANANESYKPLAGQLREFTSLPAPPTSNYSPTIASLEAFYLTARNFVFSEDKFMSKHEDFIAKMKEIRVPSKVLSTSLAYGQQVADHVIAYSKGDNYAQIRTFPKYSITRDPAMWRPTPPGYMDGIEPHWREIRPFVIDSAQQFRPAPPTAFDMTEGSPFYKEALEVYTVDKSNTAETKEIASFWDCNPYKLNVTGHVMHATKKITPGGHWISIIAIVCRKAGADYNKSAASYALTAVALSDAFISCWDEKYRSNLVRPETVINEHIDENWVPFLQTPPFPEHTSGHSVISRAAAIALTSIFGDNFSFDDDTEVQYGIPIRSFKSFMHASEEAAVSRLYGGIHYRPAIDVGIAQGQKVGELIVERLTLGV